MNIKKDLAQLLRAIRKQGYEVDTRSRHYKVIDPDGKVLFGISRTPSGSPTWKRILADCRRAGIEP